MDKADKKLLISIMDDIRANQHLFSRFFHVERGRVCDAFPSATVALDVELRTVALGNGAKARADAKRAVAKDWKLGTDVGPYGQLARHLKGKARWAAEVVLDEHTRLPGENLTQAQCRQRSRVAELRREWFDAQTYRRKAAALKKRWVQIG